MTVDPDTGVVTWTASGPMFDRSAESAGASRSTVSQQSSDGHAAGNGLRLATTRCCALARRFPVSPSGLSLADLDDDGDARC